MVVMLVQEVQSGCKRRLDMSQTQNSVILNLCNSKLFIFNIYSQDNLSFLYLYNIPKGPEYIWF